MPPTASTPPAPHGPTSSAPQLYAWLAPDATVQAAIDAHRSQWIWPPRAHQPRPHRLHLTLHPLGVHGEADIARFAEALAGVRANGFELVLDWSGVWPHNGIAIVTPRADADLERLHGAIGRAVAWCLPQHGPGRWTPHVTIGRHALHAAATRMEPIRWKVRDFLFVRSWLPPHPAWHEVLGRYPLR